METIKHLMMRCTGYNPHTPKEVLDDQIFKKYHIDQKENPAAAAQFRAKYPGFFKGPQVQIKEPEGAYDTVEFFVHVPAFGSMKFTIQRYPACCGALMFHHFNYDTRLDAAEFTKVFGELMQAIMDYGRYNKYDYHQWWGMYANNRRLIVMMVQGDDFSDSKPDDPDNPRIHYPYFYEYFKKHQKSVAYMYNENSGNLLHHMEVIVP